jgi:hypothetical protein
MKEMSFHLGKYVSKLYKHHSYKAHRKMTSVKCDNHYTRWRDKYN